MKVLIISGSYPPIRCGVSEGTVKLSTYLRKLGVTTKILTSTAAHKDDWSLPLINSWTFGALGTVLKTVTAEKPDLIHIEYPAIPYGRKPFINFLPLFLRLRFPRIPVVIRVHEYHDASLLGRIRILITVLFANRLVIPNRESIEKISRILPWKKFDHIQIGSNIAVIPLSDKLRQDLIGRFELGQKQVVTYFGLVDPSKGVEQLLSSLDQWPANSKLVIATHYNNQNDFHRQLKQLVDESRGQAVWTGFLEEPDISGILQLSDLVTLPFDQPISLRRGSMLAAIVHGIPVITTGPASPPLIDGENIIALPDNESDTIAKAVNRLLTDDKLRKLLRVGALKLASNFDWTEIAKKHLRIYEELAN